MNTPDLPTYDTYDPSTPPNIDPEWIEPSDGRAPVQQTHTWQEVADDFADRMKMTPSSLYGEIVNLLGRYQDGGGPHLDTDPDEEEACWTIHQIWLKRNN